MTENNRRAKYYRLTRRGRKRLEADTEAWRKLTSAVGHVLDTVKEQRAPRPFAPIQGTNTAWSVSQRTREIGIRVALGARRGEVLRLFLRYGLKLTLIGLSCGILASLGLRKTLDNFVYGVSTVDPAIYASVSVVVLLVALLACYIPARRATKVDALISLRYE